MKRLHKITPTELEDWKRARMNVGQTKYGDRDTKRYNLVDVMEELLDVLNILERFENRAKAQGYEFNRLELYCIKSTERRVRDIIKRLFALDEELPDSLRTDENGGERIWWK
jgi:hypothetical protein